MKKRYKVLLGFASILLVSYLLGPKPKKPLYDDTLPKTPSLEDLEKHIKSKESVHKIKPGNEAEIVWADPEKPSQTEFSIVYLHGFSASKQEGNPVHLNLAKKLNANLYLSRLAHHGIDTAAAMQHLTADDLWESSKEAYAIAKKLGKKVIVIGTSTGGTLALKLASIYPEINSLILISPNIAINNNSAWLLNDHWGLQIARTVKGGKELIKDLDDKDIDYPKYWYTRYRLEAVVELGELVESTMQKRLFQEVKQPLLLLYYYKNKIEQDDVVRVDAMMTMFKQLGTSSEFKRKVAIPNGGSHVLGSYITSKDLPSVERAIGKFTDEIINK